MVELAGDPAGEMLGKLLAEMGADVIKVEPPGGIADPFDRAVRRRPCRRRPQPDVLVLQHQQAQRRRSTTGPPTAGAALDPARSPAPTSCISTLRGRRVAPLGIDLDRPPCRCTVRLIVVSITPFGLDGPWADWASCDLVGLALGSPLNSCGYDDHSIPPIRPGGDQGYQSAASFALMGLMLALVERQQTGRGQLVDVGMHDCLAVNAELANPYWFYPRALVHRQTCRHAQPTPTQPALFQCGDDRWVYFVIFVADQKQWQALLDWIDSKGLAVDLLDPEFDDPAYPPGELRPHPGGGRDLLPPPDGRGGLPRRPGPGTGRSVRSTRPTTCSTTSTCWRGELLRRGGPRRRPAGPLPGRPVPLLRYGTADAASGAQARRAHRRGAGR